MKHHYMLGMLLITMLGFPPQSTASPIFWDGTCEDCISGLGGPLSPANAYLEVAAHDNTGSDTSLAPEVISTPPNLLSFEYYSQIFQYGVFSDGVITANGLIPDGTSSPTTYIEFYALFGTATGDIVADLSIGSIGTFQTDIDGSWSLFIGGVSFDVGQGSVYTSVHVPEPSSLLIFSLAILTLGRFRVDRRSS